MANKDKVQADVRGGSKPGDIKRIRPKAKSNIALIKQIKAND